MSRNRFQKQIEGGEQAANQQKGTFPARYNTSGRTQISHRTDFCPPLCLEAFTDPIPSVFLQIKRI